MRPLHAPLHSKRERFFQTARALAEFADTRRLFVLSPAPSPRHLVFAIGTALALSKRQSRGYWRCGHVKKQSANTHAAPYAASPFTLQQTLIIKEKWNDRNNLACRVDPAATRGFPFMAAQP